MHGHVDAAVGELRLDLLGKQPLAANLGERPVGDAVALGTDNNDFDLRRMIAMGGGDPLLQLIGLRQRQFAAARADSHRLHRLLRAVLPAAGIFFSAAFCYLAAGKPPRRQFDYRL